MCMKLKREMFSIMLLALTLILGEVLGQQKSAFTGLGSLGEIASQDKPQKSDVISPEVMNAINAMSRSVGGVGYVWGLGWVDLPSGRELQMTVKDNVGRRWILGVDQASAKPTTKVCFAEPGSLAVIDDKMEPNYGTLNTQPLTGVVGRAVNREMAKVREESKAPARITAIKAVASLDVLFVVYWESEPSSVKGSFAINTEGKTTSPPKEQ